MIVTLAHTQFKLLGQWFPTFSTYGLLTALHLTKRDTSGIASPKFLGGTKYLTLGE